MVTSKTESEIYIAYCKENFLHPPEKQTQLNIEENMNDFHFKYYLLGVRIDEFKKTLRNEISHILDLFIKRTGGRFRF